MILEHEIPNGSKLYFGESAKIKRHIEQVASEILDANGFEEIVTPVFSYHQHKSIADERELIRLSDDKNNALSLRADATIDVVRIIEKRLGSNTNQKKWFYIQPVFTYPTTEQYQVGVEHMGECNLAGVMGLSHEVFTRLKLAPLMQISNMRIPHLLVEMFEQLSLDDFRHINIDKLLGVDVPWMEKLVYLQHMEQLDEVLEAVPEVIRKELEKMRDLCHELSCENTVLAPIYYAKMLYYDELFFRAIVGNEVYARGGRYKSGSMECVGFAIYTDVICEQLTKGKR